MRRTPLVRAMGAFALLTTTVAAAFATAPSSEAAGPTVGVADSMTVVRPTITPTGLGSSIDLVAARGEYESVQLVVSGPTRIDQVSTSLGPWAQADVYAERPYTVVDDFPADTVAADYEYPGGTRQPTDTEARGPNGTWNPAGRWFDALVPERDLVYGEDRTALPMTVAAGEVGVVWIDFFVPTGATAGPHDGSVTLTDNEGATTTLPVHLEVLNWTMPATSGLPTVFMMQGPGGKVCVAHGCTGTAAEQRQQRQLLSSLYSRMAVEDRISLGNGFGLDYGQAPTDVYTAPEFETKIEGPVLRGGTPYPPGAGFHLGGARQTVVSTYTYATNPADNQYACRTACADGWEQVGSGESWAPNLVWYGCDEAKADGAVDSHGNPLYPQWSQCASTVAEAEAGWNRRVMVTGSWENWSSNGGDVNGHRDATATGPALQIDVIAPYFDQIVPNNTRTNASSTRGQYDAFLASDPGHQAWLVTACNAGACGNVNWEYAPANYTGSPGYAIDAPANQSRAMSWYVDRWDMDGEASWAANQRLTTAWTAGGQYESGMNGDGTLFYPGTTAQIGGVHDIPIESIRLKRVRDGHEDWEYIHYLRTHGKSAEVDAIVDGLYPTMYDAKWTKDGHGAGSLLAARAQLVDLVRELNPVTPPTTTGRIVYSTTAGGNADIHSIKPDGTDDLALTTDPAPDGFPAWSPDSTKIAFSRGTRATGANIWVMGSDGSGAVKLTSSAAGTSASKPAWSPDGAFIYYVRTNDAGSQILRIPAGGGAPTAVVAGYDPSIHPDGRIYHSHAIFGGQHIFAKTLGGSDVEVTYGAVDEAVDVSPDGSLITYSKTSLDYSAPYDVFVTSSTAGPDDGTAVIEVAGNAYQSAFSPTGDQLTYVSDDGGSQIWRADVDGTDQVAVTSGPGLKQDPDWGTPPTTPPPGPKCNGLAVTVNLNLAQTPTARADVILGTAGNDTINAAGGNDTICGLGGDDVIQGGPGDDWVDGGAGTDTASYVAATAPVTVSLASATPQATGASTGTDTLRALERAWGGQGADRLTGNGAANRLEGRNGDDTLLGANGNDALIGGAGTDTCNGGAGTDTVTTCERKVNIP
ncbi:hypothetical protein [Nocardioides sp. MH1]|uniref:hypothetical protein n=1 Tax=Nocardioides sp. MH1 TaxID=3242490 RepID=UPI0035224555